ncbi:hypothetical protein [Corynebacterium kroppenstedtii]|uniref:hypothetical protein n=1 Tax=Corynebacterium kroppenstedtii TaxID=161879 RepID=UPI0026EB4827|nr:hypothetical protein [Corynebacterium kroppenstedtii]
MSGNNQWNGGNDQWGADRGAPNPRAHQQVPDQPKKRSRAIPILWTILALVVIAAVVVIAVQVINNRASNNTSADGGAASSEATTSPAEESQKNSSTKEANDSDNKSGPSVSERCTIVYMHQTGVVPAELDDVEKCDGTWAAAIQHGTDWSIPLHWTGSEWEEYTPDKDNIYSPIGGRCYSDERMQRDGVPEDTQRMFGRCTPASEAKKHPNNNNSGGTITSVSVNGSTRSIRNVTCDGDYVLIVQLVIDQPGGDTKSKLRSALASNSDAYYTYPGACPSLRKKDSNGNLVYPVLVDYGNDRDAVCEAASRTSGALNNDDSYSSPC